MSTTIQTVKFQRSPVQGSLLSDDEGAPYTVHGVALGSDDVTVGQSGIKKLWPAEELQKAAESLKGRNLVEDHNNSSRGVVGKVTKAGYKEGVGVIYEAELFDEELAEKIEKGLLEVSIRGHHVDVEEMEEDDETGAKVVEGIKFDNLSIVPSGAAPSNSIDMGEHEELSVAELSEALSAMDRVEELQEMEAGDPVQWGDKRGVILTPTDTIDEGDPVEVDIYEESDDKWRPIGETEEIPMNDLSEWDVDMDDFGKMKDSDEEEARDIPEEYFFESEAEAEKFVEDKDGLTGTHEMEEGWAPGETHEEFLDWLDEEEMAGTGEKVQWDSSGGMAMGIVRDRKTDGCFDEEIDGDQRICADDDDAVVLIEIVRDGEPTGSMVAHKESTLNSADFEMAEPPEFEDGMMVQWQVNPDMFGEIVHAPDDEDIVMVKVHEMEDGEPVSTGFTITAGYSDIMPMGMDEEAAHRSEGEEEVIDSDERKRDMRAQSPERFTPDEIDEELQEVEVHTPNFSGTTESDWSKPALEDFGDDPDMGEVADHFLVSRSGFPPENYGDLALPVVEPNGDLNLSALQNAKARAGQVEGVSDEDLDRAVSIINSLAEEEFDTEFEENSESTDASSEGDNLGMVPVLTSDDLRRRYKSGESEQDSILKIETTTMTDIEEKLAELDEPVAVEESDLEDLREKADRFDEMAGTLDSLKERTDILDEVDREQVEELAESEEPVVIESARFEALNDEAEQVKGVYAAALSEAVEVFDAEELTDKFSIEELRSKYEEHIGDPSEELASADPEPRSGDVDEEELEEASGEGGDELSEDDEQVAEMQAELREKILGDR